MVKMIFNSNDKMPKGQILTKACTDKNPYKQKPSRTIVPRTKVHTDKISYGKSSHGPNSNGKKPT